MTCEPYTAVVAVFLERQIYCLEVDTDLGLIFEVERHSGVACTTKSVFDEQLSFVPVMIVCQFRDVV